MMQNIDENFMKLFWLQSLPNCCIVTLKLEQYIQLHNEEHTFELQHLRNRMQCM